MPKLLWVALPLLLLSAFLAVQAMRRRLPSRRALNAWSSVLLLAYLMATAGLGIFWVANQQLPVFDWHYLFGYATVLLVAVHLTFNLRLVWRYFTGPRAASSIDAPHPAGRRRGLLATLAVVAAAGTGFTLGLRRGRGESGGDPQPDVSSAGARPAAAGLAFVERFHEATSHSRAGVLRAPGIAWAAAPASFKRYANAERVDLPAPGRPSGSPLALASLAALLWHTSGVTETRGGLKLRASPSSGALFSTELYVVARSIDGLPPGLWHYDAESHALQRLSAEALDAAALGADGDPLATGAPALVVATAVFARTGHKYRDRTYRYVLADLGHALENLRLAAAASGIAASLVGAFDESQASTTLGVDEREEGVLALVGLWPLSVPARAPVGLLPGTTRFPTTPRAAVFAPALATTPNEDSASPPGVTASVHTATSLRAGAPRRTAESAVPGTEPPPATAIVLATPAQAKFDVLAVIAARRSVRRFAPEPMPVDLLAAVLAGAAREAEPALSAAVRVGVLALRVASLPAAAYRYEPRRHALARRAGPDVTPDAARAAALGQDVIGDAAAVFVLSVDRSVIGADTLGAARGYRHAFLEAGLLGERIYLHAGAHRLGVCGVGAFYDAELAELAGIDLRQEWVVHLAALGVPAG